MAFRVARKAGDDRRVPHVLSTDLPTWRRSDATRVRDFSFRAGRMNGGHGWVIGGEPFDPARTDVTVRLGEVEIWRLVADVHHPVRGRYLFHCHNAEHEDMGMMANFEVI
ncbi:multicopper oxidase domain-containing protein [Spirillospora sp. CA-108201]